MLFAEAVRELINGNYISRDKYDTTGEYYVLLPGMQYVWKVVSQPNPAAGNWLPLMEDLIATDWKVVSNNAEEVLAA